MSRADNRSRIAQVAARGQRQAQRPAPATAEDQVDLTGKCGSCRFWEVAGLCRRFPPTPVVGGVALPRTGQFDWCGEHKPMQGGL